MGRPSAPFGLAKAQPAVVTAGGGTNLSRVTLLPEAVRRLDIQKVPVREETLELKRRVGGEVISAGPASAIVRVELTGNELNEVAAAGHGLVGRQLVVVDLTLEGDGRVRRIVPHGAVLCDARGCLASRRPGLQPE